MANKMNEAQCKDAEIPWGFPPYTAKHKNLVKNFLTPEM
jgi:hypothetical protein